MMVTGYQPERALAIGEEEPTPACGTPPRRGQGKLPSWEGCRVSGGVGLERLSAGSHPVSI